MLVWFIIHERSQLHPKTHPCLLCESSLPIMKMNGKCIVRFPFRSLREASRPSARESYKFMQHRWQVSSKNGFENVIEDDEPQVTSSRSTPLQVLGVRYTIQWPACCESKKRASRPYETWEVPSDVI